MLIGIDASHALKPNRTGVEEYCYQIIQHLKKIIPAEHRVILYCNSDKQLTINNEQSKLISDLPSNWQMKVLPWPLKKLWSQTRLAVELLFHPPDVFFAPGQLIPWVVPKNTTVMLHDSAFKVFPEAYHFWGRNYLKLMNWWILRCAQKVLTSSKFNQQELQRLYPWFDIGHSFVVPLAFDSARFTPGIPDQKHLARYGLAKPYFLFVGRLEEKKNVLLAIEAFTTIKKRHDVQLLLVGKPGVGYEKIALAIRNNPFKQDIITPGFVPSEEMIELLRGAVAFIFPSRYEGFGLPILEAMDSGVPVIAAKQTALMEVGADAALFVPGEAAAWAKAMETLLTDSSMRSALIEKGSERAQQFSWEKTARETFAVIVKSPV